MVGGGWLRPRHKRSPSTQVHTELLNSFVIGKLGQFTNKFLKSWAMKVSTCLPISNGFAALHLPVLPLHYWSILTDTSCSQSAGDI